MHWNDWINSLKVTVLRKFQNVRVESAIAIVQWMSLWMAGLNVDCFCFKFVVNKSRINRKICLLCAWWPEVCFLTAYFCLLSIISELFSPKSFWNFIVSTNKMAALKKLKCKQGINNIWTLQETIRKNYHNAYVMSLKSIFGKALNIHELKVLPFWAWIGSSLSIRARRLISAKEFGD